MDIYLICHKSKTICSHCRALDTLIPTIHTYVHFYLARALPKVVAFRTTPSIKCAPNFNGVAFTNEYQLALYVNFGIYQRHLCYFCCPSRAAHASHAPHASHAFHTLSPFPSEWRLTASTSMLKVRLINSSGVLVSLCANLYFRMCSHYWQYWHFTATLISLPSVTPPELRTKWILDFSFKRRSAGIFCYVIRLSIDSFACLSTHF